MPEYIYDVFHGGQDFEHRKICGDGVMIDNGGRLCVYQNRASEFSGPTTTAIIAVFNMWNYYTMSEYKPEKTEPEQTKEQNG